jgi:hypothetical protein
MYYYVLQSIVIHLAECITIVIHLAECYGEGVLQCLWGETLSRVSP